MTDKFLTIIRELNVGDLTRYHKDKLTNRLAEYSIENGDKTILQYMENVVDNLIRSYCRRKYIEIEYIKHTIDYHSYKDSNDVVRGVLMVTILLDYRMGDNQVEEDIFNIIMEFLRKNNLDKFINDVNVNGKQWRRDRKISKLFKK